MKKAIIILLSIILILLLGVQIFAVKTFTANTADELTQEYISAMKENRFSDVRKLNILDELGYYPQMYDANSDVNFTKSEVLMQQYKYITSEFGENAWDNVTYQIIKSNCPEKTEEFVLKDTGEVITKNQAKKVTKEFIIKIAEENNTTYDKIMNSSSNGEKTKVNKIESYSDIMMEGISFPVEVKLVDLYDYYDVVFTFNNQSSTKAGVSNFKISICNKDGTWRIYQGLTWIIPIEEEVEDI